MTIEMRGREELRVYLSELVRSQLENRRPAAIPEGVSVDELIQLAISNQLEYLILGALLKIDGIDEEHMEKMRGLMHASMLRTLYQVHEAKEIDNAFEAAKIRHQPLKGAIMKHIYPRPEMREMSDIDMMVYEENFDKSEEIMKNLGYIKLEEIAHHVIFKKPPYIIFEMHWDLFEKTVDKEQYMYYKDQFRARLKEGTQYTYEFSIEDFYVYMISHMAKHFYEEGCGIRNLLDVYIYQKAYGDKMDQKVLKAELEKCGIAVFEKYARTLSEIWMENKPCSDFYSFMFAYMVDCGIYGKQENGVWSQLAKQGNGNKGKMNFYFPNLEYMKGEYNFLEKWPVLLPVAWIMRGTKGLKDPEARKRANSFGDGDMTTKCTQLYQELSLNFKK